MCEFKQGDMIEVSNYKDFSYSGARAPVKRIFAIFYKNQYWCEDSGEFLNLVAFDYARAISEPKRIPYTAETFPKGLVWIRDGGTEYPINLITAIGEEAVHNSFRVTNFDYEELAEQGYELSTDNCKTWQPASEEVL